MLSHTRGTKGCRCPATTHRQFAHGQREEAVRLRNRDDPHGRRKLIGIDAYPTSCATASSIAPQRSSAPRHLLLQEMMITDRLRRCRHYAVHALEDGFECWGAWVSQRQRPYYVILVALSFVALSSLGLLTLRREVDIVCASRKKKCNFLFLRPQ